VLIVYCTMIYLTFETLRSQEDLLMRGEDTQQQAMSSYRSLEQRVPKTIPCGSYGRCRMKRY